MKYNINANDNKDLFVTVEISLQFLKENISLCSIK